MKALEYIGGFGLVICLALVLAKFQGGETNPFTPHERAIKTEGPAVAVVEETSARSRLTPEQVAIFTDTTWRNYVLDKGGSYRVIDQHTEFIDWNDPYRLTIDMDRSSLPWLIVSTDEGDASIPLPSSVPELMLVLKEWLE